MSRPAPSPVLHAGSASRRELLTAGGLSLLGGLLGRFANAGEPVNRGGKAKSVISLFLHGGAATQDMWDLKPDAPEDVRGEFRPIDTSAPGVRISEHLPLTARWMHKAAIVRTVNHAAACHNTLPAFTGQELVVMDQANANPNHAPSMGSVCEYLRQQQDRADRLPAYVCLPHHLGWGENGHRPGIYGGFLGANFDPLCGDCDAHYPDGSDKQNRQRPPELQGRPQLPHGVLREGLTVERLASRKSLLAEIDEQLPSAGPRSAVAANRQVRERAFDLLRSQPLRDAFNLDAESPKLRERYGTSLIGTSLLTARRLVEAGVQFVNVFWDNYAPRLQSQDFGWDTHMWNFITLKESYLPRLDRTFSALLEDLDGRGLLDQTLLVIHSDFGRTPRVNKDVGRDHWTHCYSVLFAGGGIRGGTVYGQSDSQAAFPVDKPVRPNDLCATIFQCLGISPDLPVYDRLGRPHSIANGGRAIEEILA